MAEGGIRMSGEAAERETRRLAFRRARRLGALDLPAVLILVLGLATAIGIVVLAIPNTFDLDGLLILLSRPQPDMTTLMTPFHEHWNLVPILIWQVLRATLGIASYTPFIAVLAISHAVLAAATYWFLRSPLGSIGALAVAVPLMLIGSASYDLVAAWQILFTFSLLGVLLAAAAARPASRTNLLRLLTVAGLTFAVMSSNVGVYGGLLLAMWMLMTGRRRQVAELVIPMVIYAGWFLAYGRTGIDYDANALDIRAFASMVPFTVTGVTTAVGGLVGLGPEVGTVLVVVGAIEVYRRRASLPLSFVAAAIAVVAMFASAALFRSYGGTMNNLAADNRYWYIVAFLAAFAIGLSGRTWRVSGRPVGIAVAVLVVLNAMAFSGGYLTYRDYSTRVRIDFSVFETVRTDPNLNPDAWILADMRGTVRQYIDLTEVAGRPRGLDLSAIPLDDTAAQTEIAESRARFLTR